jgi:hypothetical protein
LDYLGLIFEIIFLALGVYMYLFAIGKLTSKDPEIQKKAEAFRQKNKTWMRIASLLLVAMMSVNIYLHIVELLN